MKRSSLALLGIVLIPLASGCGLYQFIFGTNAAPETGSSKLIAFASEAELAGYLSGEIQQRNSSLFSANEIGLNTSGDAPVDGATPPTATDGDAGGSGQTNDQSADTNTDYSGTTIQEQGVDESDVVKTDGHYLYMVDDGNSEGSILRIVDVSGASLAVASETTLDGWGREIYLYGDKVVALTSTGGGFFAYPLEGAPVAVDATAGDGVASSGSAGASDPTAPQTDPAPTDGGTDIVAPDFPYNYQYERPRTVVTIFDVSDPTAPVQLSKTSFEGSQTSSRMVDGVLHLVVANYQSYYYDVFPALGTPELDPTINDTTQVLPRYNQTDAQGTTTSGNIVTWESIYRPVDPDGFGIVSVISLDVDNDAAFTSVGIAAEPGLVYSSTNALYLTDTNYNYSGDLRETTDIYKFNYVDRRAEAVATGTVPGRVLNQYSMGEKDGYLRVATTTSGSRGFFAPARDSSNDVYVLGQNGTSLDVAGSVVGLAPGESIQSARFVGDRGFVVTFQQIDPFFTLDLSDPTNPIVVGKLEVPGYSTFIVPMDENHVLTVGQYIPAPGDFGAWGVQLSIYDITDFANPTEMSKVVLGQDSGAYSEALYNPKAFTYYPERGMVALPLSIYDYGIAVDGVDAVGGDTGGTDASSGSNSSVGSGDVGAGASGGSTDAANPSQVVDAAPPPDSSGSGTGEPGVVAPDEPTDVVDPYVPSGFEGVAVFSATVDGGLTDLGRISTRYPESGIYWSSYTRGVFLGDDILAVTNKGMRRAATADTDTIVDEIEFE